MSDDGAEENEEEEEEESPSTQTIGPATTTTVSAAAASEGGAAASGRRSSSGLSTESSRAKVGQPAARTIFETEPHCSLRLALSGWGFTDLRVRLPQTSHVFAVRKLLESKAGVLCASGEAPRLWKGGADQPSATTLIVGPNRMLMDFGFTSQTKEYTITYDYAPAGSSDPLTSSTSKRRPITKSSSSSSSSPSTKSKAKVTSPEPVEKISRAEMRRRSSPLRRFARPDAGFFSLTAADAGVAYRRGDAGERPPCAPGAPPAHVARSASFTAAEMRSLNWGADRRKLYQKRHMTPPSNDGFGLGLTAPKGKKSSFGFGEHVNPVLKLQNERDGKATALGRFLDETLCRVEAAFPELDAPSRAKYACAEWREMVEQQKQEASADATASPVQSPSRSRSRSVSPQSPGRESPQSPARAASMGPLVNVGVYTARRRTSTLQNVRRRGSLSAISTEDAAQTFEALQALAEIEKGEDREREDRFVESPTLGMSAAAARRRDLEEADLEWSEGYGGGQLAKIAEATQRYRETSLMRPMRGANRKVVNDLKIFDSIRSKLLMTSRRLNDMGSFNLQTMWNEVRDGSEHCMFNPLMRWLRVRHGKIADLEAGREAFLLTVCQEEGYDLFGKPLAALLGFNSTPERSAAGTAPVDMMRTDADELMQQGLPRNMLPLLLHNILLCNRLAITFRAADIDGNDSIDIDEFSMFTKTLGLTLTPEQLFEQFDAIDFNDGQRDNVLHLTNICAWYSKHEWMVEAAFRQRELQLLHSCDLFHELGHEALHRFSRLCVRETYTDGELVETGPSAGDYICFVCRGGVSIAGGGEIIAVVNEGGFYANCDAMVEDRNGTRVVDERTCGGV